MIETITDDEIKQLKNALQKMIDESTEEHYNALMYGEVDKSLDELTKVSPEELKRKV